MLGDGSVGSGGSSGGTGSVGSAVGVGVTGRGGDGVTVSDGDGLTVGSSVGETLGDGLGVTGGRDGGGAVRVGRGAGRTGRRGGSTAPRVGSTSRAPDRSGSRVGKSADQPLTAVGLPVARGGTAAWLLVGSGTTTGPTLGVGMNGVPWSGSAVLPTVAEPALIAARIGIEAVPASSATVKR